jgi:hypothetical protein
VREGAEIGNWEGEESIMTACRDGEAAVVRGNGKPVWTAWSWKILQVRAWGKACQYIYATKMKLLLPETGRKKGEHESEIFVARARKLRAYGARQRWHHHVPH